MPPADATALTVATINLFGWHGRPAERFPLIAAGLSAAWPDLIALQEVSVAHQSGERLQRALNAEAERCGSRARYAYVEQHHLRNLELSVGILARRPVLDRQWLDLQGQGRVALGISTEIDGARLGFVSTHLFWDIGAAGEQARAYQAGLLRDWVAAT